MFFVPRQRGSDDAFEFRESWFPTWFADDFLAEAACLGGSPGRRGFPTAEPGRIPDKIKFPNRISEKAVRPFVKSAREDWRRPEVR
jgi:hypothetical protein